MTTTTITAGTRADAAVTPIRQVSFDDLRLAADRTAALIDSGASPAEIEAAAAEEVGLADMYVAGHGTAYLDYAAQQHLATIDADQRAQAEYDTWAAAHPGHAAQLEREAAAEYQPEAGQ